MKLPKRDVVLPACLAGKANGKLDDAILVDTPGLDGGALVRLVAPAARAWRAMTAAASAAGVTLQATSAMDSFRPYKIQERIFKDRYTLSHLPGRPTKTWNGRTYWQKPNTAVAAIPGHSNHGLGLAVDTRTPTAAIGSGPAGAAAFDWLLDHALDFGFSWELDSEKWHLRYFAGDNPPPAVTAAHAAPASSSSSEEDPMPLIPRNVKATKGRWPAIDLVDVDDDSCTVLVAPGIALLPGLDKFASPKFTYGPKAFGNATLRVEGLPGRPRLAEAPDGSIVLVTAGSLGTFALTAATG